MIGGYAPRGMMECMWDAGRVLAKTMKVAHLDTSKYMDNGCERP